jgi:hypothetical protein
LDVVTMTAPPTAVQDVDVMQLILRRVVSPAGVPRSDQSVPPSAVSMTCVPTAKQVVLFGHAIPSSGPLYPVGINCGVHVSPPFVVATIAAPGPGDAEPIAVQCRESEQAMPLKLVTVEGESSLAQETPPLVVPMMLGAFEAESKLLTA